MTKPVPFIKSMLLLGILFTAQLPGFADESPDYTIKSAHDCVVVPLDGKYKLSTDQKLGSIRVISFFLPGENLENYTSTIGVMSTPVGELKTSPRELTQKMIDAQKQLKEQMPTLKLSVELIDGSSENDVLSKSINGELKTTIFTRAIKGTDAIYQVQYQLHSATVSKDEEQKAIDTLKKLTITSTAATPFQPVVLQKSPYEVNGKTETLSIPVGTGWKIVEDRVREPMPFFQYADKSTVRMVNLVPESDSLDSFAKMLKIEILPVEKAAMTPRQIMKMGAESMPSLDGCSMKVIEDKSDSDVLYDATFSKPVEVLLSKISASDIVTRIFTGADSQYRISMVFPTADVEVVQKNAAIDLLKGAKIVPHADAKREPGGG